MTRSIPALTLLAVLVASSALAKPPSQKPPRADKKTIARGEYLVTIMACADCHTPWVMGPEGPHPDKTRWLSGHPQDLTLPPAPAVGPPWVMIGAGTNTAYAGPWGVSFTANLTPDDETGLGQWTEAQFVEAIRTGRHEGRGRPILPPMPWPMYKHATDADLSAIFAYLRSLPPIRNRVPQPIEPQPIEPPQAR